MASAPPGTFGTPRMFIDRGAGGEAEVVLADSKGRDRIRLKVDAGDVPSLEFLDEEGKTVYRLPPEAPGPRGD